MALPGSPIKELVAWDWWTAKASRTWLAHGFICLAAAASAGAVHPEAFAPAAAVMAAFFWRRELADRRKHRHEWNKPSTRERVTWAVDMAGDLVGPFFVLLTALAARLLL